MRSIDTDLVHAGAPSPRIEGAVVTPVFQSANFEMADEQSYGAVRYMRLSNSPNHRVLAAKLAAIEGAEAALPLASGMAAISATLLTLLGSGDHLISQRGLYGGTATLLTEDAARLGIAHTLVDGAKPESWSAALRPQTRVFYVEGLSNPTLRLSHLPAVVAFCREHGLVSVIDNTFLSPVNFRPLEHGFDLVVHSATKYLNGHSDIVAGVVAGSSEHVGRVLHTSHHLGGSLDAHACFLFERGLKTLGVRVRRQNATAQALALCLADHPAVRRVNYPGLPRDPGHALATTLFDGFGGMMSFEAASAEAAARFVRSTRLFIHAASLGGIESLCVQPARSSHLGMPPAEREAAGVTDSLVRLSIGLEDPDDLWADLQQALG